MTIANIETPFTVDCPWCGKALTAVLTADVVDRFALTDLGRDCAKADDCPACGQRYAVIVKQIHYRVVQASTLPLSKPRASVAPAPMETT